MTPPPKDRHDNNNSLSDAYDSRNSPNKPSSSDSSHIKTGALIAGFILALLLFSALVIVGTTTYIENAQSHADSGEPPNTVVVSEQNYSATYESVSPSVVSIYANGVNGTSSQGSGFVYDTKNHIVTNWHVISEGETFYVRYSNGEWTTATVIGSDPYTDLAVLKVKHRPESATPLPMANEVPRIGEPVMTIGSPDNLRGSMSTGVVSGVNRSMTTPQGFVIPDMVQTDAPLNPGNSGGPLVSMDGTVLGVNRARQGDNLGFAVSGRIIHSVVPTLIEDGEYSHSLVGIRGTTMTPTVAEANNMALQNGILVTEVMDDSPSSDVLRGAGGERIKYNGFEVYKGEDLIVAVDGHSISTNEALTSYLMRETQPGDTIEFTVIRDGEKTTVDVTLGERPEYNG